LQSRPMERSFSYLLKLTRLNNADYTERDFFDGTI
jgi:hypothetical protein